MGVSGVFSSSYVQSASYLKELGFAQASTSFQATLAAAQEKLSENVSSENQSLLAGSRGTKVYLDTNKGRKLINLDEYFSPPKSPVDLDDPNSAGLLGPSPENIKAISNHLKSKMQELLRQNNIPVAPSEIDFDSKGEIQFPEDYKYAEQFKEVLEANPAIERELSTVHALADSIVNMLPSIKYTKAYLAASTNRARDAVNAEYSYLFYNHHSADVRLHFSSNLDLKFSADGKSIDLDTIAFDLIG